jgi:curved DNA-binding protein
LRAHGRDLHLTLPVAPWEAALGAVVSVELPGGSVKVRIPEGAQSGRQLRVRGKGIPGADRIRGRPAARYPGGAAAGKYAAGAALYERMARELAFDPRQKGGCEPCVTTKS